MAIGNAGLRPGRTVRALVAVVMAGVLTQVSAAIGGAQFRISPDDGTGAWHPVLAADAQGRFVAAWTGSAVFARRYDVDGTALGSPIQVNAAPLGAGEDSAQPDIAMTSDGAFVVVWQSYSDASGRTDIFGQRFDAAGQPVGSEFQISSGAVSIHRDPAVAMEADGGFVVVWRAWDPGVSHWVRLQRFTVAGEPSGPEVAVGSIYTSRNSPPDVAADAAGVAHVVWKDRFSTIFLTRVAGGAVVGEAAVASEVFPNTPVRVALLAEGPIVAWHDGGPVFARRFDFAGQAFDAAFRISTVSYADSNSNFELAYGSPLALAANETGAWMAVWSGGDQVYGRRYAEDGSPDSAEFVIDKASAAYSRHPAVVVKYDGNLITALTLQDEGQPEFVRGQLYQAERDATDTDPDPYTFPTRTNVEPDTLQTSDPVTITGFDDGATVQVQGGEYSVDGGAFTDQPGLINAGAVVRLRHATSPWGGASTTSALLVGQGYGSFVTVNRPADTTPDPFVFGDLTEVARNTVQTSNAITVSGLLDPAPLSVMGGTFSLNGAAFQGGGSTVVNGDSVRVRHTSSSAFSTSTTTTLRIGGFSENFVSTTLARDGTPDAFVLPDLEGVEPATVQTSEAITVTGINDTTTISVTGGSYSVNGGAFVTASSTVGVAASVRVRHTSSAVFSTSVTTTLTIGGVSESFVTTTRGDTQPDPFTFSDVTGAPRSTTITSNEVAISGISVAAPISITGGQYSVDGGAFTDSAGTIANGQRVRVWHTTSSAFSSATHTVLTVGGVADTFTTTTQAQDVVPDAFSFAPRAGVLRATAQVSDPITVSGINDAAPVSVMGGTYSIDGGAFTAAVGTVTSGQTVRVRHTSASTFSTIVTTTLNIGGVSGTFSSTTGAEDTTPDPFTFEDRSGVMPLSEETSNVVVIRGINSRSVVTVSGGTYSVNGAPFTTAGGTVGAGDLIRLRVTSAALPTQAVEATLTVGGVSDTWTVRTLP